MFSAIGRKMFGSANERIVRKMQARVAEINALEPALQSLSDAELQEKSATLKQRAQTESLDALLPEAFALVREASKRVLGMRHFDVQLVGGMVLHAGMIAEMKTGEGKTLVATLPCYLNALTGKGVHVVTVNDYLAKRDAEWMGRLHGFLGLSVGCITHEVDPASRKQAYACDITYGTNNEFGFDYLRDNMKFSLAEMVQRPFNYAIVDEVDSILIDEARTPLIISGPTEDNSALYVQLNKVIPQLVAEDYEIDEKGRSVAITETGVEHVEAILQADGLLPEGSGLYDIENIALVHHMQQALRAHKLFTAEVDYIVKDGKVMIIDEFTGRMMEGRRYSEGLHQALEAKENVPIQNENQTLASITFQNYFRMFPKLSGMTGTAMTEAAEFDDIYRLKVVEIPTNVSVQRKDEEDVVFRSVQEKYDAIVLEIVDAHRKGQPVLVGTASIEKSELLSSILKNKKYFQEHAARLQENATTLRERAQKQKGQSQKELLEEVAQLEDMIDYLKKTAKTSGIPHQVLNARYHAQEAFIIAQAGQPGAVTIATNMAGRGTDIMLGGNAEMLARQQFGEDWQNHTAEVEKIRAQVAADKKKVLESGGLFVLGTERHESRRIDNQLRGRSGRQGDPGRSLFYLSMEDDLLRIFISDKFRSMMEKLGLPEGEPLTHPWMTRSLEKAQQKVEQRNYDIRKNLLKFDDVMNDQRKVIYEQRRELMDATDLSETVEDMREDVNHALIHAHLPPETYPESWDLEGLGKEVFRVYGQHLPVAEWAKEEGIASSELLEKLQQATSTAYAEKEQLYTPEILRMAEKHILLQALDELWKEHLLSLDHLRQGIHLRGYAQKNPLNEYKREAFELFETMLDQLREVVITRLSHLHINVEAPPQLAPLQGPKHMTESRRDPSLPPGDMDDGYQDMHGNRLGTVVHGFVRPEDRNPGDPASWGKVARNEPCPCGSGRKYKQCHGSL